MTTTDVENYPGFPEGVSGPELMQKFKAQAIRFGTEVLTDDVVTIDLKQRPFTITGKKSTVQADCVIISTGATRSVLTFREPTTAILAKRGDRLCRMRRRHAHLPQ